MFAIIYLGKYYTILISISNSVDSISNTILVSISYTILVSISNNILVIISYTKLYSDW